MKDRPVVIHSRQRGVMSRKSPSCHRDWRSGTCDRTDRLAPAMSVSRGLGREAEYYDTVIKP